MSRDLKGLGRSAELAAQQANLADKAMTLSNARASARGATSEAQGKLLQIDKQRNGLVRERNSALQAQQLISKDIMATEQRMAVREQSRARYQRQLARVQETISTAPSHGLSQNQLAAANAELQRWQTSINRADADIQRYNNHLKGLNKGFASAQRFSMGHASAIDRVGRSYSKAAQTVQDMSIAERNLKAEQYLNSKAMDDVARSQYKVSKGFDTEQFTKATHAISGMGRLLQYAGAIGVGALGFAANSAAQLSKEATLAATQVGNTTKQVRDEANKNFDAIITNMARFPAASADMSQALYDIFSTLNVNGKQGRDILVQLNKAAVAGSITVQGAGQGVLSVLSNFKNFKQTGAGVAQVLTRSFAAVRFGRMTMDEFQRSLQTTAPAANQTGQSFNNLAGTVAFLSRSLGSAKASVGYARLLQQLVGPKMVVGLKQHGISVRDAAGNYKQLDVIMGEIAKKFPLLTRGQESAQNFFKAMSGTTGTIQGARAFTSIIRNISGYRDILHKTVSDNNEFGKSFTTMSQSLGVQWERFLNALKAVFLTIGKYVIPVFAQLAKPLGALVKWFTALDEAQKKTIGKWIAYAAIGAVLIGVFLSITASVLGFVAILGAAEVGMAAFGTAFIAIAAIAALGILIYKNWSTVGPVIMTVVNAIVGVVKAVNDLNSSIIPAIALFAGLYLAMSKVVQIGVLMLGEGAFIDPEAVAVIAAVVAGFWLLNHVMHNDITVAGQLTISAANFAKNMRQSADALHLAAGAQQEVVRNKFAIIDAQKQVSQYAKEVHNATPGTLAYRDAQENLAKAQSAVATATHDAAIAQAELNTHLKDAATHTTNASRSLANALEASRKVAANLAGARAATTGPNAPQGFAGAAVQTNIDTSALDKAKKDVLDGIAQLPKLQADYQNLLNLGVSPTNKSMVEIRTNMGLMIAQAAGMSKDTTAKFLQLNNVLGRVAEPREIRFLANTKQIIPGVREFMKLTHEVPSLKVVNFLSNHRDTQVGVAALISTMGKIPKESQLKFLTNIPSYAIPAIANLIRKVHGIPSAAQIKIAVKGAKQIDDARKKVEKLHREQQKQIQFAQAHGITTNVNNSKLDAALRSAQQKLDKLTHKHNTASIYLKTNPKDPSNWANSLGQSIKTGIVDGVHGLSGSLTSELNAQIDVAITAARKHIKSSSPSKKTRDLIGLPLIQGVIQGVKTGGKTGLADAMNTAVDNMISMFESNKSTFQSQLGDLFTGGTFQTKIDWGESLNIGDLTKDLSTQVHTFSKFQNDLSRIGKRKGVSGAFIEQLRQLGPANQAEIDALLKATPRQLRRYVKLWEQSQKAVNKTASRATKNQMKIWNQQGKNVALGFMSGMTSYEPQLTRFFRRIFLNLYNSVQHAHKSHSPSKLYMAEGVNVMAGFQLGLQRQWRIGLRHRMQMFNPTLLTPVGAGGTTGGVAKTGNKPVEHHDHTHYHMPEGTKASEISWLKREDFRRRRRK